MVCGLHVRLCETSTLIGFKRGEENFFFLSFETTGSYLHSHARKAPPPLPSGTEDQLKSLVQSFLTDFFSQSGQLGTNPLLSAPPAVPNSVSLLREAAGGLSAVTPSEVPLTESPCEVLPMTQEDLRPPNVSVHDVSLVRGVVTSGGSPFPGHCHSVRHDVTDQLRVSVVSYESSLPPLSALSPTSFLFPSSDPGFVSLYSSSASLSSRPPSCVASSASSSFTPLSSSGSVSSFSLPPLSYPPPPFRPFSCCGGFGSLSSFWVSPSSFFLFSFSFSFYFLFLSSFSSFSAPLSSSSSLSSYLLPSSVSFSSSLPVSSSPFVSSASSSLDYASYKADE